MTLMQGSWTSVPEVRAGLVDLVIPQAMTALPAQVVCTNGTTFALQKPSVFYGTAGLDVIPSSSIIVGDTTGETSGRATLPDVPTVRSRDERFGVRVVFWYEVGEQSVNGQRYATEACWAMYRALAGALRADQSIGGVLKAPGNAFLERVDDADFVTDNGRLCVLRASVNVFARV